MSLIIQCVNISKRSITVEEYFLKFLKVDNTSSLDHFNELQSIIETFDLNIDDIRGQGYDNGSNIKKKN